MPKEVAVEPVAALHVVGRPGEQQLAEAEAGDELARRDVQVVMGSVGPFHGRDLPSTRARDVPAGTCRWI